MVRNTRSATGVDDSSHMSHAARAPAPLSAASRLFQPAWAKSVIRLASTAPIPLSCSRASTPGSTSYSRSNPSTMRRSSSQLRRSNLSASAAK